MSGSGVAAGVAPASGGEIGVAFPVGVASCVTPRVDQKIVSPAAAPADCTNRRRVTVAVVCLLDIGDAPYPSAPAASLIAWRMRV